MSQSWTWPRVEWSDGAVEAMKWLGLLLMTADHAQKYGLMPTVPGVYEAGRVAFPLFGIVLAYNLARVQSGRQGEHSSSGSPGQRASR